MLILTGLFTYDLCMCLFIDGYAIWFNDDVYDGDKRIIIIIIINVIAITFIVVIIFINFTIIIIIIIIRRSKGSAREVERKIWGQTEDNITLTREEMKNRTSV